MPEKELSKETIRILHKYIEAVILPATVQEQGPEHRLTAMPGVTKDKWYKTCQTRGFGDRAWYKYQFGGTWIQACVYWYQHIHKPGSSEWRPAIIMGAVLDKASCYYRLIHANCPAISKIALKFDVTEEQVRSWIESGKGSCYGWMLPDRGEAWGYRTRAEMTD